MWINRAINLLKNVKSFTVSKMCILFFTSCCSTTFWINIHNKSTFCNRLDIAVNFRVKLTLDCCTRLKICWVINVRNREIKSRREGWKKLFSMSENPTMAQFLLAMTTRSLLHATDSLTSYPSIPELIMNNHLSRSLMLTNPLYLQRRRCIFTVWNYLLFKPCLPSKLLSLVSKPYLFGNTFDN